MDGGRERRQYPRSRSGFPLVVEDPGSAAVDYIENISCGGALCRAIRDVPMMGKIALVFDLPGDHPQRICCDAVVVRREEEGDHPQRLCRDAVVARRDAEAARLPAGVVFTNISTDTRDAIGRFVSGDLA